MEPLGSEVDAWSLVLGFSSLAVLVAVVGTWPVCALLLHLYRRAVVRGMTRTTPAPASPSPASPSPAPASPDSPSPVVPPRQRTAPVVPPRIGVVEAPRPSAAPPVVARSRRAVRVAQRTWVLLGLAYGLGVTAVYHVVEDLRWLPLRTLSLVVLLGWLALPTALSMAPLRRRTWALAWAGYLSAAVVLVALGGSGVGEAVALAVVAVVLPGLFVLVCGRRSMRGAAWLVAPSLVVLGLVAVMLYPPGLYLAYGVPFDRWVWTFVLVGVLLLVALVAYVAGVVRLHQAKWASDQTLLVLQWWLVSALWTAMLLGTQGGVAALLAMVPFGLLVVALVVTWLASRRAAEPPVRLLLLRTFGARGRSERLLRDLALQWRWVGSVELITAPDLASETLEPDEFLDFLRRRLSRRFVRDEATLRARLADLDLAPDRDGRYRVNELMCHDDAWRAAVEELVGCVQAVLVDLRGFTATRAGVAHELERLVARVPLQRVVALVDTTTDPVAVDAALQRAAAVAPPGSPVHSDPAPALRLVVLDRARPDGGARLLDALALAAAPVPGVPSARAVASAGPIDLRAPRVPTGEDG